MCHSYDESLTYATHINNSITNPPASVRVIKMLANKRIRLWDRWFYSSWISVTIYTTPSEILIITELHSLSSNVIVINVTKVGLSTWLPMLSRSETVKKLVAGLFKQDLSDARDNYYCLWVFLLSCFGWFVLMHWWITLVIVTMGKCADVTDFNTHFVGASVSMGHSEEQSLQRY